MGKIVYVDPRRPDNSGDGLSAATAKKTWNAGYALAVDGDTLRIPTGVCLDPSGSGFSIIRKSNITVETYAGPEVGNPIFDALIWQAPGVAGWTSEGDGVWSKQFSTSWRATRMWIGATNTGVLRSQRNPGTAWSRTPDGGGIAPAENVPSIKAALNTVDIWHPSGSALGYKIYVFTGSDTLDPPTYYGGLAIQQNDAVAFGSIYGIAVTAAQNVNVTDMETRGATTSFEAYSSNTDSIAVLNVAFVRCNGTHIFANSFRTRNIAGNYVNAWLKVKNVTFTQCIGDSGTSQHEQEKTTAYSVLSGAMDMYSILHNSEDCVATDCTSINSFHIGALIAKFDYMIYGPTRCGYVRHAVQASSWATYARGFATYAVDNTNFIKDSTVDGQNVRSQFSGAVKVTGTVWKNLRQSIRKPNTDGAWGIESYIINCGNTNYGNDRLLVIQPEGMLLAGNLVVDPWGPTVIFNQYEDTSYGITPNAFPAGSVSVYNNIFIDTRASRVGKGWLEAEHTGSTLVGVQPVENNIVFKGAGAAAPTVKWEFVFYALNALPGFVSNLGVDPLFDTSALVTLPLSPCRNAGKWIGDVRGANGVRPWPLPTIGPVQVGRGDARTYNHARTIIRPR